MTGTHPLDLFDLDDLVGDEERAIQRPCARSMDAQVRPHLAQWYDEASLPARELAVELGKVGLLGMHLTGYGCAGTSATAYGLACLELEAADAGVRSLVSVQGSLAMFAIWKHGSDEQKDDVAAADGHRRGHRLLRADRAGRRLRPRRDAHPRPPRRHRLGAQRLEDVDHQRLDRRRRRRLGAATDDGGSAASSCPPTPPGFSAPEIKRKLSLRASVTSELVLDDVRLPADAVLPEVTGLRGPLSCLTEARFGIIFGSLGAARDSLETALRYAAERDIFGRSLGSFQLTQAKLADMTLELGKGMLLALHLGRLKDDGRITPTQVSLGKLNNVREAIAIARECRTILGAAGITLEHPVMRHANNLESVLTYEGTSEVHQLVIGQALTGESAFR